MSAGGCYKCSNCDCRQTFIVPNPIPGENSGNNNYYYYDYNYFYPSKVITTSGKGHSSYYQMGPNKCAQARAHHPPPSHPNCMAPPGRSSSQVMCGVHHSHQHHHQCQVVDENKKLMVSKRPPFKPYCGDNPRVFTAPPILPKKNKAVTSTIRNYDTGPIRNFVAVPQAVTLFEENPFRDVKISRDDFETLVAKAYATSTAELETRQRNCTELNEPKFNSLKKSVREIQRAVGNLQKLPFQIEKEVKNDPTWRKKIQEAVTKRMNIPFNSKLYQDLISLETPEGEKARSAEEILKGMKALQPTPKNKDAEPNILNFNKPTFARIKPRLPEAPPKPQQGVSINLEDDYQLIRSEREFNERGSNRSLFQAALSDPDLDQSE